MDTQTFQTLETFHKFQTLLTNPTYPEVTSNPYQFYPKGEPATSGDRSKDGGAKSQKDIAGEQKENSKDQKESYRKQKELTNERPLQREASELLAKLGSIYSVDSLKKYNLQLEASKDLPNFRLAHNDSEIPLPKEKPDALLSSFERAMRNRIHDIPRVTSMGEGIHDGGNGITITKVGGGEVISRGKDQVAVSSDGKIFTSEGAKVTTVKLTDSYSGNSVEGNQVTFESGLRVVIYNGHIVQYGIGGMSYPSRYRVESSNKERKADEKPGTRDY